MIRVGVKSGLIGEGPTNWHEIVHRPGITFGDIRRQLVDAFPMLDLLAAIDGEQVEDGDEVPAGAVVVICPRTAETVVGYIVYAIISAVVSLAINYVVSLLSPPPKPPGVAQDRGDDSSPTYAWDAIQTSYGQGQTIAVVLGRHAVGGQVIYSRINADPGIGAGGAEQLLLVLALCEGPVARIGNKSTNQNLLGGFTGPLNPPVGPPLQTGLFINDNLQDSSGTVIPDVATWLRMGQINQSALPADWFPGASTLFNVNQPLNAAGEEYVWTYNDTDAIDSLGVLFRAPAGLYQIQSGGTTVAYPVQFEVRWRYLGETFWRQLDGLTGTGGVFTLSGGAVPGISNVGRWRLLPPGQTVDGPIQLQVVRITAQGAISEDITQVVLRSVELIRPQEFAYPAIALEGIAIASSATFSGALPRFKQTVDGTLVRLWDAELGFSSRLWDSPVLPSPYSWCALAGRNPAWILGEFATNKRWGMGNEIGDDRVDWPALRRWGAYCQEWPTQWSESRYMCDLVLDSSRPAWETVMRICWAGGAAPLWKGGKLSVVYQYRDSHTDGGITVPAKAPVQLINSALCTDVQVRWLPQAGRATALDFQYLDETQGYAQNVLQVEDVESTVQDPTDPQSEPFVSQVVQAYGVTRSSQLVRMGMRMHRQTRLIRRELTFECGPWMLAAEVGDLIDFQHDMLRPFADDENENRATVCQVVAQDFVADFRVIVDHAIDLVAAANDELAIAYRSDDGSPGFANINGGSATTYRGRPATLLTLDDEVTALQGQTAIVGYRDKLVETYQIVSITLGQDLRRQVRCVQWVPEIFDPVSPSFDDKGYDTGTLLSPKSEDVQYEPVLAEDLRVSASLAGRQVISWQPPGTQDAGQATKTGGRARVYIRDAGGGAWVLVGETTGGSIEIATPTAWRRIDVAVALEDSRGNYAAPDASTKATLTVPEFPPRLLPAPADVEIVQQNEGNRLLLSWSQMQAPDVVAYEIRAGEHWSNGPVLWRGTASRAVLEPAPAMSTVQIAAVHVSGLHGRRTKVARTVTELPYAGAAVVDTTEHAPTTGGGAHSGTQAGSGVVELAAGNYLGKFASDEVDIGYEVAALLRVALEVRHQDNATVSDLNDFEAGTGEGWWRTVDARPASPLQPGVNWRLAIEDVENTPVGQLAPMLASGLQAGEAGAHVDAYLESRTYFGGVWSEWQPHRDRVETCQKWQARVRLGRDDLGRTAQTPIFRLQTLH